MSTILKQLQQAVTSLQKGHLSDALRVSQGILKVDPRNFDALHIVALASYHKKDLAAALANIEKALGIRSDIPDAFNSYGLILRAAGRVQDAARQFAKAVKHNPKSREAHYNLANCYQDLGQLTSAIHHYDAALRVEPGMVQAWNNRGLALKKLGQLREALASFDQAIRCSGKFAPALYNRGDCLAALRRFDEALRAYDEAIALHPDFAEAHCNRANVLVELHRPEEALAGYDKAVSLQPRFHQAHLSRGISLAALKRNDEAEKSFRMAIALKPDYADAHYNLGKLLKEVGRPEEAVRSYDEAIRLRPAHAESHSNRGNALRELGRHGEALADYDAALKLNPEFAEAHTNRGNALSGLDRLEEALASHEAAIRLKPDFAEVHNNRGNALSNLNRLEEALASYDRAILLQADYAEAYSNRGNTLRELNRLEAALDSFDTALRLAPEEPGIRYNKSIIDLQQHRFEEGFAFHRSRWQAKDFGGRKPATSVPNWDGRPVEGEVLLWGEQGLGDEVFYASMFSLLNTDVQRFAVSSDKRLHAIYRRSFPDIRVLDRSETDQSIAGSFAAQAAIGDIGDLLHVDEAKLARRRYPYLSPDAKRKAEIVEANSFLNGRPVCGLSWRSGNKKMGSSRSLNLADLAPAFDIGNVTFVNLQYGDVTRDVLEARERIGVEVHVAKGVDAFHDIDGLLSLIDLCDVVLTIDNVTAHLAGAIGKQSIVLVPTGRGRYWYWGGEETSFWYPSLRLVYQKEPGDWAPGIEEASTILKRAF